LELGLISILFISFFLMHVRVGCSSIANDCYDMLRYTYLETQSVRTAAVKYERRLSHAAQPDFCLRLRYDEI
jgi:hypothetical protein